jgi:hypothetical protein
MIRNSDRPFDKNLRRGNARPFVFATQHQSVTAPHYGGAMQHELIRARFKEVKMPRFTRTKFLTLAAAGALAAFAAASSPASADEYATNFGPVGPNEPILAKIGGQRVIAFFVPDHGSCAVNTIMWKDDGLDTPYTSSRVRLSLRPGEMVRFDGAHLSMNLLCGADASTLALVAPPELMLTGATRKD